MRPAVVTVFVLLVVLPGIVACEAVPSLSFAQPDATALDTAPPARDAPTADSGGAIDADASPFDAIALDAGSEAADAGADGASADAATEGGCPGLVPDGASVCCGSVACDLDCLAPQCAMCEQKCAATDLCCARNNNVTCVNPAMGCH